MTTPTTNDDLFELPPRPAAGPDPGDMDLQAGLRQLPCRWCGALNDAAAVYCAACGHNCANVRGCGCAACTRTTARPRVVPGTDWARQLVLVRHSDRVWRGAPGSASLFGDRGQVVVRTAEDLLGLAIRCWSSRIDLLLRHADRE